MTLRCGSAAQHACTERDQDDRWSRSARTNCVGPISQVLDIPDANIYGSSVVMIVKVVEHVLKNPANQTVCHDELWD